MNYLWCRYYVNSHKSTGHRRKASVEFSNTSFSQVGIHASTSVTIVPFVWLYLRVTVMYIIVLGQVQYRMFGCLGDRVMCLPPRRWRQAGP